MMWDVNLVGERDADTLVRRFVSRASPGDIVVIHDGDDDNPRADRRYAVETVDRLIPALKARGFQFGTVCPQ
jgi:peptidoglycan/xylan/chitin deacetylase (PgdA/CDA1 family)